jgi:hypothetical protein
MTEKVMKNSHTSLGTPETNDHHSQNTDDQTLFENYLNNLPNKPRPVCYCQLNTDQKHLYRYNRALIEMYIHIVDRLARKIKRLCKLQIAYEDLISVGVVGLSNAMAQYGKEPDDDFEIFCVPFIKDALVDAVRYAQWFENNEADNADCRAALTL